MGGVDVKVRLRDRLSLAPQARLYYMDRSEFLTGYVHRGPDETGPVRVTVTLAAIVAFGR